MTENNKYKLSYLVEGNKKAFPVIISRDANIFQLAEIIYQMRGNDLYRVIDSINGLTLWKVEIDRKPHQGLLSKIRVDRQHHTALDDLCLLVSEVWDKQPPTNNLHVLVTLESSFGDPTPLPASSQVTQQRHLTSLIQARAALSPSSVAGSVSKYRKEQIEHPIYNGRPIERRGPPVVIYNKSLAELKDNLHFCNLQNAPNPSAKLVGITADLFHAVTTKYDYEKDRENKIYGYLECLLNTSLDRSVWTHEGSSKRKTTEADAIVCVPMENYDSFGTKVAVVAYIGLKNELGECGDSGLQAALSLRKYVSDQHYDDIRNASCCPCIIISITGPYLLISGAVFVEVFSVQNFTDHIYMGGNPFENEQVYYVAKVFAAVAHAVKALGREYYFLDPKRWPLLPSPTYLPGSPFPADGSSLEFKDRLMYEGKLEDSYLRSLFVAEYDGKTVVVKFCEQYGGYAHRTLADAGLAPKLFYCSKVAGGLFMVVMEKVNGRDSYSEFRHRDLPQTVLGDVKRALGTLHELQLVYGDMRRPNIIVFRDNGGNGEWRGLLVDFDWSGRVGVVKYPPTLNTSGEIKWAEGVERAGDIQPKHDLDMLDMIIDGTDG